MTGSVPANEPMKTSPLADCPKFTVMGRFPFLVPPDDSGLSHLNSVPRSVSASDLGILIGPNGQGE
jgi:hypothetical protein